MSLMSASELAKECRCEWRIADSTDFVNCGAEGIVFLGGHWLCEEHARERLQSIEAQIPELQDEIDYLLDKQSTLKKAIFQLEAKKAKGAGI